MKVGLRILLGYFLIVALAGWLLANVFVQEVKPGVRQAMEDTLADTANVLAELATDDFLAGRIDNGQFARRVRALADRRIGADIWGFDKHAASYRVYVTDARGIVVFDSSGRDVGKDYSRWNDVYLTLHGRYGARSSRSDPDDENSTVMHVAAPIRDSRAAANNRIGNILKKAEGESPEPYVALLREPAEKVLFERVVLLAPLIKSHVANEDYADALKVLASVRSAVDLFFDEVMVNVEEPMLRANRLGLLKTLFDQLNAVADISKLGV